jgi:hypothetical protein
MRKLILLAVLLTLCVSGAAFAQDKPVTFCGSLSEADCAILTESQAATQSLDSASFELAFNLTVSNIPQMTNPLTVNVTGSGAYSGISAMTQALTADLAANPGDLSKMLTALVKELNFDGTIVFTFSPEIVQMSGLPESITIQERLVDGIGYLNLDTLSGLMGRQQPQLKGWYGLDLAGLLGAALAEMPDMFNSTMPDMSAMQDYEQALMNPDFYSRFISVERTDDGSGDTAVFAMKINMAALMSSPEFSNLMRAQMQMQSGSMSEKELGQATAMMSQMFKGMSITVNEEIGLTDHYMHRVSGTFSFDTTGMMKAMNSASGSSSTSSTEVAPKIDVDFSYTYSDFNDAPAIIAPEDATIIPYQSLMQRQAAA